MREEKTKEIEMQIMTKSMEESLREWGFWEKLALEMEGRRLQFLPRSLVIEQKDAYRKTMRDRFLGVLNLIDH